MSALAALSTYGDSNSSEGAGAGAGAGAALDPAALAKAADVEPPAKKPRHEESAAKAAANGAGTGAGAGAGAGAGGGAGADGSHAAQFRKKGWLAPRLVADVDHLPTVVEELREIGKVYKLDDGEIMEYRRGGNPFGRSRVFPAWMSVLSPIANLVSSLFPDLAESKLQLHLISAGVIDRKVGSPPSRGEGAGAVHADMMQAPLHRGVTVLVNATPSGAAPAGVEVVPMTCENDYYKLLKEKPPPDSFSPIEYEEDGGDIPDCVAAGGFDKIFKKHQAAGQVETCEYPTLGSMVLMNQHIVHRSAPQKSGKTKVLLYLVFDFCENDEIAKELIEMDDAAYR